MGVLWLKERLSALKPAGMILENIGVWLRMDWVKLSIQLSILMYNVSLKRNKKSIFTKKYYDNANEVKKKFNSCRVTWLNLFMFQNTRNMKKVREAI